MEYAEWEPYYIQILEDFGYDARRDAMAGDILAELLSARKVSPAGPGDLKPLIQGKSALIIGPAFHHIPDCDVRIAADSAVPKLMKSGVLPDIIFTDLDGGVNDILAANSMGALVLVHAHGDNIHLLRRYVPHFRGKIGGTVQCKPEPPFMNFGGFTDGDRAAFLASSLGAEKLCIAGFDFENPVKKPGTSTEDIEIKKRKLEWARRLLSIIGVEMV